MEAQSKADDFIAAGLAAYGIEADEIELAVIGAPHQTFWPPILQLLALDTSEVPSEQAPDLSQAPRCGAAEMLAATAAGESGPYRALRDAGAVVVGVGNMHELGASSTGNISVYGPARNPWNPDRCPGGSSSGPAAAVAARLVAGAVGADGVGSIRYPAAYCGLTGLKPTFGRSAMAGHHMAGVSTTIVSGPLCADAGDRPDRQQREPRRRHPRAPQPSRSGAEPARERPAQVPADAAGGGHG